MLIIFEGPDGVGKTTLVELVSNMLSIPVYRQSRPPIAVDNPLFWNKMYQDRQRNFILLKELLDFDLIVDRWHVSEMVYSRFMNKMRDGNRITDLAGDAFICDAYKDSIIVNVRCHYTEVCKRAFKRDDKPYEFTEAEFATIMGFFTHFSTTLPFKKNIQVFTDDGRKPEIIAQAIVSQLELIKV